MSREQKTFYVKYQHPNMAEPEVEFIDGYGYFFDQKADRYLAINDEYGKPIQGISHVLHWREALDGEEEEYFAEE
jgi:hypothetical protein